MPLVLAEREYDCWLENQDPEQPPIEPLLSFPAEAMMAWTRSVRSTSSGLGRYILRLKSEARTSEFFKYILTPNLLWL
jgi:hypothetical protein